MTGVGASVAQSTTTTTTTTPSSTSALVTTAEQAVPQVPSEGTHQQATAIATPQVDGGAVDTATPEPTPARMPSAPVPSSTAQTSSAVPTSTPVTDQQRPVNGKKIPFTGKPTENPNDTVIPGQMRSDREEIPEGYTKEGADKAEIAEAKQIKERRLSRSTLAALAATDCMTYWPEWRYQVCGEIRVKYDSLGGSLSFLLLPTSNELVNPDGVGRRQTFLNGPIYWHPAAGAHPVVNHFMMKWGTVSWEGGVLGYPTSDEVVLQSSTDNIGRRQEFQGGYIYWHPTRTNLNIVTGAILVKYLSTGAQNGPLGYPKSDEIVLPETAGRMNTFEFGNTYWSPSSGAHPVFGTPDRVSGRIMGKWAATNFENGPMGYPIEDEQSVGASSLTQKFQGGTIGWPYNAASDIAGEIGTDWDEYTHEEQDCDDSCGDDRLTSIFLEAPVPT